MAPRREDMLKKKREKEKLRREKIKNDPELWKLKQEKEREWYKKKLEKKQIKLVKDMTEREHRIQKKEWRVRAKKSYHNKKTKQNKTHSSSSSNVRLPAVGTPNSPATSITTPLLTPRQEYLINLGKQRRKRTNIKNQREISKLKNKIIRLQRRNDMLRKREERLKVGTTVGNSPRSKVRKIITTCDKKTIARKLIFAETLRQSLCEGYKQGSLSHKRIIQQVLNKNNKVLKKYRLLSKYNFITSRFFSRAASFRQNAIVRGLNTEIRTQIRNFFESDDVSRMCPGKKDCVTFKKVKKQKRYLLDSMKSLHEKFSAASTYKIGYTSFCKLRPFWVLQPKIGDRDTCVCKIHANIEYLTGALFTAGAIDKKTPKDISAYVCCDSSSVACLHRRCSSCVNSEIPYLEFEDKPVSYQKWVNKKETITLRNNTKKSVSHTCKETINSTILGCIDAFEVDFKKYMIHEGVVIHQYREVDSLKRRMGDTEVLVHCDFSENYAVKYGQEVQAFHFGGSRSQITLHTVQVYFRKDPYSEITSKSVCTLSKSLEHGPAAVWAHLCPIFEFIREQCPKVETIHFLSDSPSTQYRNKTLFYLISKALKEALPVKTASWNYCAAGHGKGAPDGIGGTLKRTADNVVAQGVDIGNFETFVATLQAKSRTIKLLIVEESEIAAISALLPNEIKAFKGTMKVQQVIWSRETPNHLKMNSLSCLKCMECKKFTLGEHVLEDDEDIVGEQQIAEIEDILEVQTIERNQSQPLPVKKSVVTETNSWEPKGRICDTALKVGAYLLTKFESSRASRGDFRYVCCLQAQLPEGEYEVQGMRSVGISNREFEIQEHDSCVIRNEDIIQILPDPKLKISGRKIVQIFPFPVDVKEM